MSPRKPGRIWKQWEVNSSKRDIWVLRVHGLPPISSNTSAPGTTFLSQLTEMGSKDLKRVLISINPLKLSIGISLSIGKKRISSNMRGDLSQSQKKPLPRVEPQFYCRGPTVFQC